MSRGRKPIRHHAVRAMQKDRVWADQLEQIEGAVHGWLQGGPLDALETVLAALETVLETAQKEPGDLGSFTRDDKVVWAAARYKQAAELTRQLKVLYHTVDAHREQLLAGLAAASTVPADIPLYGVKFIKTLLAEGGGQADLHPPTRAKAKATLAALRQPPNGASADQSEVYPDPPVRAWSDLPRHFAGFRLVPVSDEDIVYAPDPLPPFTDITKYTADGSDPGEGETRLDTYINYSNIIRQWGMREGRELQGATLTGWAMLLGHRLAVPDIASPKISGLGRYIFLESPWTKGEIVTPVWIGEGAGPPEETVHSAGVVATGAHPDGADQPTGAVAGSEKSDNAAGSAFAPSNAVLTAVSGQNPDDGSSPETAGSTPPAGSGGLWDALDLGTLPYRIVERTASSDQDLTALKFTLPPCTRMLDFPSVEGICRALAVSAIKDRDGHRGSQFVTRWLSRVEQALSEEEIRIWSFLLVDLQTWPEGQAITEPGWYHGLILPGPSGTNRVRQLMSLEVTDEILANAFRQT